MATIAERTHNRNSWTKCTCCSESIRYGERYLQVVNDNGKDRRGERYCPNCERYARMNNDDIVDVADDAENRAEREREAFAAYQAAGVSTDTFMQDRNAGYVG